VTELHSAQDRTANPQNLSALSRLTRRIRRGTSSRILPRLLSTSLGDRKHIKPNPESQPLKLYETNTERRNQERLEGSGTLAGAPVEPVNAVRSHRLTDKSFIMKWIYTIHSHNHSHDTVCCMTNRHYGNDDNSQVAAPRIIAANSCRLCCSHIIQLRGLRRHTSQLSYHINGIGKA
jgi:hypothetical protein